MKCPKCAYLGFEATDRCRNCGYDFSLTAPVASRELALHSAETVESPLADFVLHDADEDDEPRLMAAGPSPMPAPKRRVTPPPVPVPPSPASPPAPPRFEAEVPEPPVEEELPLFTPPPAGTPLAVRRPGAEVRRTRRNTTRPVRFDPPELPLVAETPEAPPAGAPSRVAHPRTLVAATPGSRVGAALIDAALLLSLDLLIVVLTIRVANLSLTLADIGRLRPAPMAAFFGLLAFLYLVAFTISGGQTVGKMIFGLRVTGDDGRPVDLTGAVVRALGGIVSFLTLGALFVPVLFDADRRAVHDRLAGTRVVSG